MEDAVVAEGGGKKARRGELRISYRAAGARIQRVKLLAKGTPKEAPLPIEVWQNVLARLVTKLLGLEDPRRPSDCLGGKYFALRRSSPTIKNKSSLSCTPDSKPLWPDWLRFAPQCTTATTTGSLEING